MSIQGNSAWDGRQKFYDYMKNNPARQHLGEMMNKLNDFNQKMQLHSNSYIYNFDSHKMFVTNPDYNRQYLDERSINEAKRDYIDTVINDAVNKMFGSDNDNELKQAALSFLQNKCLSGTRFKNMEDFKKNADEKEVGAAQDRLSKLNEKIPKWSVS